MEPGQELAHYRLVEKIGEGGMGVVWRGEDTKLGRSVAIKVLPELFASDPERLARFEREAKLLAALNHPNIAHIHGLEEDGGVRFLVLELVGGETLAERLRRGPVTTDDALDLCRQIAEALGAAHEQGILHRDLKPANIKITEEDKVKVLDFGLAKAVEPSGSDTSLTASPTLTTGGTAAGVIVGTASYMAPEQARGKAVDKRADVWAFGCLLYECLTARKIFDGETVTDILGAILHREPDWALLPADLPASIPRLLKRCLQRSPRERLHDIADARIILEEAKVERSQVGVPAAGPAPRPGPGALGLAVGAVVLAVAAFLVGRALAPGDTGESRAEEIRFTHSHPQIRELESAQGELLEPTMPHFLPPLAFSPDGRRLVYAVRETDGPSQLYLREMGELEAVPIRGSRGAFSPFFSPDGEAVGFSVWDELRTVRVSGGTARTLVNVGNFKGATWTTDDHILFTPAADAGIFRVSAQGGKPEPLTTPDPERGERTHRFPQALPGGAVLMTVGTSTINTFDDANIAVWSPGQPGVRVVIEGGMCGRYLSTGHILFARDHSLLVVPFDLDRLEVTGRPEVVVEGIVTDPLTGSASYAVSRDGGLAFVRGRKVEEYELWKLGLDGATERLVEQVDYYADVEASPDGKYLALEVDGANSDIWIYDVERRSKSRLTFEWNNLSPRWTPDGTRIAYMRGRAGTGDLFWTLADGSGQPEELLANEYLKSPESWSPDGKILAYDQLSPETGQDIWLLDMEDRSSRIFLQTPFMERYARFSPDGKWIAYISDETGRWELFVRPFPGPGGKAQISIDGAGGGDWAPDGRSLLFYGGGSAYRVAVDTTAGFRAGRPEKLFERNLNVRSVDLSPDGDGWYIVLTPETPRPPAEIQVLVNWTPPVRGRS